MSLRMLFVALAFGIISLLVSAREARAYPWMIRHGYTQCATCHADPVGGGLLSHYGRAQGEILMQTRYGTPPDKEPSRAAEPLFGALPLPAALEVGGSFRFAQVRVFPSQGESQGRFIVMQSDLLGQLSLGRVRVNGAIGAVDEGASAAAITRGTDEKVVSRSHWVGVDLGASKQFLLRAGRMNVPFGLRSIEHTRLARVATRTDLNATQQYGVEIDYHHGPLRASVMGIAGNFLVSPDRFRSRGYAGSAEVALSPTLATGVSSMATQTVLDLELLTPSWRHAHGAFGRYSPTRSVVVAGEWSFLHTSQPTPGDTLFGGVGLLNVDLEPVQGVHVGPTFEWLARDFDGSATYGAWASAWWFFLPHADVRVDAVNQSVGSSRGRSNAVSLVMQLHFYL